MNFIFYKYNTDFKTGRVQMSKTRIKVKWRGIKDANPPDIISLPKN
jgi:hypothetical protein